MWEGIYKNVYILPENLLQYREVESSTPIKKGHRCKKGEWKYVTLRQTLNGSTLNLS